MSTRSNGGIIGPQNRTTSALATGIWHLSDNQQSVLAKNWPGSGATVPNSPNFALSASFTASISGNVMTVSAVASGALAVGQVINDDSVILYTTITAQLTGSAGSTGTYTVSYAQTVTSNAMSSSLVFGSIVAATSSVQIPYAVGYNGGSAITGVTATIYSGSTVVKTVTGTSSPLTATLIPNGTVYSVDLYATNAKGNSARSIGPYFKTPAVPDAPTIGTVTSTGITASVPFTAPTNNNGSTITGYTAVSSPGGISASSATSPISVPGLSTSTTYTFTVYATNAVGNSAPSAASNSITTPNPVTVTYLIVGGGGGGSYAGGGGGGVLSSTYSAVPGVSNTVTVGPGGTASVGQATAGSVTGNVGTSSSVFGFTATGGGGGGNNTAAGGNGASGGGAGSSSTLVKSGGTGSQGNNGGSNTSSATPFYSGGGGGAGAVGGDAVAATRSGNGGIGVADSITASSVYYGGGGGGAAYYTANTGGAGTSATGGGGAGATGATNTGTAGTANSGGGGGGAIYAQTPGAGGSGVVIVRTAAAAASTTGSPTLTRSGGSTGDYIYKFTGSGSITY
jgi:hypothetical protein